MTYKAVVGPQVVGIKKGNYQSACDSYAALINSEAKDGWKFYSMETITTTETVGCLWNKHQVNTEIYMLIFCKES